MTGAWVEPTGEDVRAFMATVVVDRADEDGRISRITPIVVRRVRGVVGRCNVLSDNPNEVPPEGLQHTLVLIVSALLTGTPNFGFLMRGEGGTETGVGYMVRQAEAWLEDVKNGLSVTTPTNVSTDTPALVRYGGETEIDTTAA